jgi:uncharacterized membrane protein YeaQ/YmgE (transglycosylase-associated protein family)
MSPIAIWVLMGLLAGLLAGFVTKRGGYGRRGDVLLGLVGSVGVGWFCSVLGAPGGPVAVAAAFVGAAILIALQRWLWPARAGRAADGAVRPRGTPARPVWGVER